MTQQIIRASDGIKAATPNLDVGSESGLIVLDWQGDGAPVYTSSYFDAYWFFTLEDSVTVSINTPTKVTCVVASVCISLPHNDPVKNTIQVWSLDVQKPGLFLDYGGTEAAVLDSIPGFTAGHVAGTPNYLRQGFSGTTAFAPSGSRNLTFSFRIGYQVLQVGDQALETAHWDGSIAIFTGY